MKIERKGLAISVDQYDFAFLESSPNMAFSKADDSSRRKRYFTYSTENDGKKEKKKHTHVMSVNSNILPTFCCPLNVFCGSCFPPMYYLVTSIINFLKKK